MGFFKGKKKDNEAEEPASISDILLNQPVASGGSVVSESDDVHDKRTPPTPKDPNAILTPVSSAGGGLQRTAAPIYSRYDQQTVNDENEVDESNSKIAQGLKNRFGKESETSVEQGGEEDANLPAIGGRKGNTGRHRYVPHLQLYTAPTSQVCGLFPFVVGSGSPKVGVPLGQHVIFGETICFDPFFWLRDKIVTNPGVFVIGQPGIGKSSTVKRLIMGMAGFGHRPLILGDVKPDYPDVIRALGGQVISLGRGKDRINPLDKGPISYAAKRLEVAGLPDEARRLNEEATGRRLSLLVGLCEVGRRGDPVLPHEEVMLANCLNFFDNRGVEAPLLSDVVRLLRDPPMELVSESGFVVPGHERLTSQAEREMAKQTQSGLTALQLRGLEGFLNAAQPVFHTLELMLKGSLRGIFDGPTTTPMDLDAPAVEIDISSISSVDDDQGIAASMLAVWSYSFSTVDAALELSDAGLIPRRNYVAVLDELWRALRGSSGLVDRIDSLTRVNRQKSMAQIMVTHSLSDLEALTNENDRAKARGLIDRSGTKLIGAVPSNELDMIAEHVGGLTRAERDMVSRWTAPADWSGESIHPGMGRMLIKAGERSGLPVAVTLTPTELELYETTKVAVAELERDVVTHLPDGTPINRGRMLPPAPPDPTA